uniref:Uncharacterized protein n=1 Tax=Knipowitschia caucasica TaxID=637954 RepID=A0AAV2MMK8_KNICA
MVFLSGTYSPSVGSLDTGWTLADFWRAPGPGSRLVLSGGTPASLERSLECPESDMVMDLFFGFLAWEPLDPVVSARQLVGICWDSGMPGLGAGVSDWWGVGVAGGFLGSCLWGPGGAARGGGGGGGWGGGWGGGGPGGGGGEVGGGAGAGVVGVGGGWWGGGGGRGASVQAQEKAQTPPPRYRPRPLATDPAPWPLTPPPESGFKKNLMYLLRVRCVRTRSGKGFDRAVTHRLPPPLARSPLLHPSLHPSSRDRAGPPAARRPITRLRNTSRKQNAVIGSGPASVRAAA